MRASRALRLQAEPTFQHAPEEEYAAFLRTSPYGANQLRYRTRFVQRYPSVRDWFHLPLAERVNRLPGEDGSQLRGRDYRVSYCARPYLVYLGMHGYAQFDWEWLIAVPYLHLSPLLHPADARLTISQLVEEAVALGYEHSHAELALHWGVTRILLHAGHGYVEGIDDTQLSEAIEAVYRFGERTDVALYHRSSQLYESGVRKRYTGHLHLLHVVLYHRGQVQTEPHRVQPQRTIPASLKPRMEAVASRYLTARCLTDRPRTVKGIEQAFRRFIPWIANAYPLVETWAEVSRDQVLEFAESLNTAIGPRTGRLLSIFTKRGILL